VAALGLDETLFARTGAWRTRSWCTSVVDVGSPSQLLDVVEGRTAKAASAWIDARSEAWRNSVAWATLDLSGPYRKAFNDSLPDATQVADPFHVVKVRHEALCVRRRVGEFQRSVHGPGMIAGACTTPRPLETTGCQARRCRCPNARRSLAR